MGIVSQSGQYESSVIVNELSIFDNKHLPIFVLLSTNLLKHPVGLCLRVRVTLTLTLTLTMRRVLNHLIYLQQKIIM